jgi:hypothetical protein
MAKKGLQNLSAPDPKMHYGRRCTISLNIIISRGTGNRLIVPIAALDTTASIKRRQRLGGLLNYYFREAA